MMRKLVENTNEYEGKKYDEIREKDEEESEIT